MYDDPPVWQQYLITCIRVAPLLNCKAWEVGTVPLPWVKAALAERNARNAR